MDARGCLIACFLLVGCSASQRIAERATEIREHADEIIVATDRIDIHGEEVESIRSSAEAIRDAVSDIHGELPGVQDRTPAWLSTLKWWGIAFASMAVALVLWQSGAFSALRVAVGWLPRRKVAQAELAVDTLDESRPEGDRELIALLRSDVEFDAAFKKAQQRRKATT